MVKYTLANDEGKLINHNYTRALSIFIVIIGYFFFLPDWNWKRTNSDDLLCTRNKLVQVAIIIADGPGIDPDSFQNMIDIMLLFFFLSFFNINTLNNL